VSGTAKTELEIFSTCPQSAGADRAQYVAQIADVARWSEEAGYRGILVYTDNSLVDPWLVSQLILESTETLCPLVAVQPIYMHPYTAAKMVASLAFLHERRIFLNMLAGGF
jgi:alkanesulfonate monooxygenase